MGVWLLEPHVVRTDPLGSRKDDAMTLLGFGEVVPGYDIRVLNEREIRAAAGLLFLATFLSLIFILFNNNFLPIKFVIPFFLLDLLIRVLVSPRYSPTLILGRLIVRGQVPEYVGAQQKKVAWSIGVVLAATMFVVMVLMNTYGPISGITCLVCLVFLFFESAFGICLGCKFYALIYRGKARYCPGEVCTPQSRQPIQKTSAGQLLVLVGFAAVVVVSVLALRGPLSSKPRPLFAPPPSAGSSPGSIPAPGTGR
jgi:hypothetical protein